MESEERDIEINAQHVVVNTGWTTKMAFWNTFGTIFGAFVGLASLLLSGVAIYLALRK